MSRAEAARILVIEDDHHIAEGLELNLTLKGYRVRLARDGESGLREWRRWRPRLVVLDIMLPGIDGLQVLRRIRREDERIPLLILSAKASAADKIQGLSQGVDDYLTKPFHLEEFLLRVERLLARARWQQKEKDATPVPTPGSPPAIYCFGGNRIDFANATADCQLGRITLTEQEVKLLQLFILHPGQVLSRPQLLGLAWGYSAQANSRTIDNFIVRFRKYFESDPHHPQFFQSRRARGYLFAAPPDEGN